jgi:glycosyltransferase
MLKISIVTAVYNNRTTIGQALDSLLSQTYSNIESLVIDGGSTDGTLEVIGRYSSRLGFLISEPDYGIYDALNKGIKNATGDVIGFLHSDDVFEDNEVLERIAAAFQDSAVDAIYGDLVYVRHDDIRKVIRYWIAGNFNASQLSRGWMPPHPTFYVRRAIYENLGGFDIRYQISADYDTILRFLFKSNIRTFYIPQVLIRMRAGGLSNRSFRGIMRKSYEDLCILRRNKVGGIFALLCKNLRKLNQFWHR